MAPPQRRCLNCDTFLPNRYSDPHTLCARCRGGKCSFQGKSCDFCSDWSEEVWKNLKPVSRPYAARNPLNRSKKPGKPSRLDKLVFKSRSQGSHVICNVSQPSAHVVESESSSTSGDEFVGFHSAVSPSQPKLEVFNEPMVVCDYEALPNGKFKVVHGLINKIHPDRRNFIKVVYNRRKDCFSIVSVNTKVSILTYEEFMRGSCASSLLSDFCSQPKQDKMKRSASVPSNIPVVPKCARIIINTGPSTSAHKDSAPFPILRADSKSASSIPALQPDRVVIPSCKDLLADEAQSSKGDIVFVEQNVSQTDSDRIASNDLPVDNPVLPTNNIMSAQPNLAQANLVTQKALPQPVRLFKKVALSAKSAQSNLSAHNYDDITSWSSRRSEVLPSNVSANFLSANAVFESKIVSAAVSSECQVIEEPVLERVSNLFPSVDETANVSVSANESSNVFQGNDPFLSSTMVQEDINYDMVVDDDGNEFVSADRFHSYKLIDSSGNVFRTQSDSVFVINQGVSCSAPIVSNDIIVSDSVVISSSSGKRGEFLRTVSSGGRPISSVLSSGSVSVNNNLINLPSPDVIMKNSTANNVFNHSSDVNVSDEPKRPCYSNVSDDQVKPNVNFPKGPGNDGIQDSGMKTKLANIQSDMSVLYSSLIETREKFDEKLENSISSLSSFVSEKFDKIFDKLNAMENDSQDVPIPTINLKENKEEEKESFPSTEDDSPPSDDVPVELQTPPLCLQDLLEVPIPEFWNGLLYDGYLYFVDYVGFGWQVLLSSDEFFLTGLIYDISSFQNKPRSKNMMTVLGRIRFQVPTPALFQMSSVGEGLVTVHPAGKSQTISKVLSPWSLSVFDSLPKVTSQQTPTQDPQPIPVPQNKKSPVHGNPSPEEDNKKFGNNIPRFLIETVSAAKQKALDENDSAKASIFQSLLEAIDPVDSPEGSERNWPLIIKTIRERFPDAMKQLSFWDPGTTSKSAKSDLVFEENEFFSQGLGWLHLVAKGESSATGKECFNESPLPPGKWLPNTVARMRRFYRHGTKDHVCLFPSAKAKSLLTQDGQDSFEVTSTQVPPSFLRSLAENLSLLREILSTMLHLQNVMRSENSFQSLSNVFKASSISSLLALKDAMTVSSQIQANFMLLQRDRFLMKMNPKLLHSRQNVINDVRTAPFDGPLISDSLAESFNDVPTSHNQGSSFQVQFKPRSFFRGIRRGRSSFPATQRKTNRSPLQSFRRGSFTSQRLPQSSQRGNFTRTGRQRPRRGGSRGTFLRK